MGSAARRVVYVILAAICCVAFVKPVLPAVTVDNQDSPQSDAGTNSFANESADRIESLVFDPIWRIKTGESSAKIFGFDNNFLVVETSTHTWFLDPDSGDVISRIRADRGLIEEVKDGYAIYVFDDRSVAFDIRSGRIAQKPILVESGKTSSPGSSNGTSWDYLTLGQRSAIISERQTNTLWDDEWIVSCYHVDPETRTTLGEVCGDLPLNSLVPNNGILYASTTSGDIIAMYSHKPLKKFEEKDEDVGTATLTERLAPGVLTFDVNPIGARVYVDGSPVPITASLSPGIYNIRAKLDGFHSASVILPVEAESVSSISLELRRKVGLLWSTNMDSKSSPSVAVAGDNFIAAGPAGVSAYSISTGCAVWQRDYSDVSGLLGDQNALVVATQRILALLDPPTGDELWKSSCETATELVCTANGCLLTRSAAGYLVGRRLDTGSIVWQQQSRGTPIVNQNFMYVMTKSGELLAINLLNGKALWREYVGEGSEIIAADDRQVYLFSPDNGLLSSFSSDGGSVAIIAAGVTHPAAIPGGGISFMKSWNVQGECRTMWSAVPSRYQSGISAFVDWDEDTRRAVRLCDSPTAWYVTAGYETTKYSKTTGMVLWNIELDGFSTVVASGRYCYLIEGTCVSLLDSETGAVTPITEFGHPVHDHLLVDDSILIVAGPVVAKIGQV